ncbi:MAG TPA: ADP-glyceromanno-heptose 6-epimerase [Hypericibacter adhaerens]|jgi:ADP-L-glycero-D-manno-heptose 6-epimerase|uniref:ADP-L-glycero-D-manno-heptose-6-epimerase n=1 Tax=Hypericibacter adhaerens TaxID=2602016 RepID=A0A5J6MZ05_9PROT|nr:ADP-glyceromanno-heptose 6-epimerase [Hypericibacter adhaerens]QEX22551.1 ADP-L-glycero-D-manno-heptose-6-epimerase [Hypericibacter adhaerens]HWA44346.1 ADP-glyceromanno-heptose 6-epimerase [Hypericibacter adhaerens]
MILVTGGAGFIGSNLVAALSERGTPAAVCDQLGTGEKWRNLAKHEIVDLITPDQCLGWLDRNRHLIELVVHLGAISDTAATDADLVVANNYAFSRSLWDWCSRAERPFIYASSAATYGDGSAGFSDAWEGNALALLKPLNLYGWSKQLFDRWVAGQAAGLRPTPPRWYGLKFFNVYGPNEYHKGAMQSVIVRNYPRVANGLAIELFRSYREGIAHGAQKRDFVHVRDCVDLLLWLSDAAAASGIYNVGSGSPRTFLDLGTALFAAVDHEPRFEFIEMPQALRPLYQYETAADLTRLRAAGYERPFMSLEAGIADYVGRYLATGDRYR